MWPDYSRDVEIISVCDEGMHSAYWGRGLNISAVSSVLCAYD